MNKLARTVLCGVLLSSPPLLFPLRSPARFQETACNGQW